jgi:hypothetical protein
MRGLKFLVATAALLVGLSATSCPSCIGKLRLSSKKPFFELYRPQRGASSQAHRATTGGQGLEALSFTNTNTAIQAPSTEEAQQ